MTESRPEWQRPQHDEFLGLPFCLLPRAQVARLILQRGGGPYGYVVTPNAYHVVMVREQPGLLMPVYRGAWLSLCDSQIVCALAAFDRRSLPLVTGSDLVADILATLDAVLDGGDHLRVLVVGSDKAAERALRSRYPKVNLEVLQAPSGLGQRGDLRLAVARACVERSWDILLLCVGCPAQELIAAQIAQLGRESGVALCVGASIDFLTGARARAPLWLRKLRLEWAYRLGCEPGRLWRRYLVESPKILRIFLAERFAHR